MQVQYRISQVENKKTLSSENYDSFLQLVKLFVWKKVGFKPVKNKSFLWIKAKEKI